MKRLAVVTAALCLALGAGFVRASDPIHRSVTAALSTAPLFNYEDAPATPDADDPAIPARPAATRSARLSSGDGEGRGAAGIRTCPGAGSRRCSRRPRRTSPRRIPSPPAGENPLPNTLCADGASGWRRSAGSTTWTLPTMSVSGPAPARRPADVAIVSDRGCYYLRFYKIDPSAADSPLVDVTADRCATGLPEAGTTSRPSVQPSGDPRRGWHDNPLDDQNTVYGLDRDTDGLQRSSSPNANGGWCVSCVRCRHPSPADA